jgi:hypothetical protein
MLARERGSEEMRELWRGKFVGDEGRVLDQENRALPPAPPAPVRITKYSATIESTMKTISNIRAGSQETMLSSLENLTGTMPRLAKTAQTPSQQGRVSWFLSSKAPRPFPMGEGDGR